METIRINIQGPISPDKIDGIISVGCEQSELDALITSSEIYDGDLILRLPGIFNYKIAINNMPEKQLIHNTIIALNKLSSIYKIYRPDNVYLCGFDVCHSEKTITADIEAIADDSIQSADTNIIIKEHIKYGKKILKEIFAEQNI
jgi:hypothetical protein